uniref:Uncharacterized protein n=1 Tax=Aegilops tauschii subsp. strangulata TaxID=200361 RepID=A0A453LRD7_AEGTS
RRRGWRGSRGHAGPAPDPGRAQEARARSALPRGPPCHPRFHCLFFDFVSKIVGLRTAILLKKSGTQAFSFSAPCSEA